MYGAIMYRMYRMTRAHGCAGAACSDNRRSNSLKDRDEAIIKILVFLTPRTLTNFQRGFKIQ